MVMILEIHVNHCQNSVCGNKDENEEKEQNDNQIEDKGVDFGSFQQLTELQDIIK